MGGIVVSMRPISTSPIIIITLSTIVKRRVAVILRPKSTSSIITTYITPLITIIYTYINFLISMTTISYSHITMDIFFNRTRRKREARKSTTATWVMGERVDLLRPISTSTVINSCYNISRGRVAVILRHIYTYTRVATLITTMINSTIERGRVAGLNITISTSSITRIHSNTFIIRNTIYITIVRVIMAGISILIYNTSITTYLEISYLAVVVACTLFRSPLIGFVSLSSCYHWRGVINCVRGEGPIASGSRDTRYQELYCLGGKGVDGIKYERLMAARYLVLILVGSSSLSQHPTMIVCSMVFWYCIRQSLD